MNEGLSNPDRSLFRERDYDACHFWVYMQKAAGTWKIIRAVWATYETNGNDARAAVNTVTTNWLSKNINRFAQTWIKANYLKDLDNAGFFDYGEDEITQTVCGKTYGPLSHAPRVTRNILNNNTSFTYERSVSPYGADYYEFNLGVDLTQLRMKITGVQPGNFSYHFIGIKNNNWEHLSNAPSSSTTYTYMKDLAAGEWDKLALVVAGMSRGGNYTINVGPCPPPTSAATGPITTTRTSGT